MDDDIREIGRLNENSFIRNRKLPFEDISMVILNKRGMTLAIELYRFYKQKEIESVSNAAFSKSRLNLNPELFNVLNIRYLTRFYEETEYETYMNRKLLIVDGSQQELLNEENLREVYGGTTNKAGEVNHVMAQSSAIYDCLNHMMIDFQIAPYETSEKELAIINIENMLKFFSPEEIMIIFDRGYPSIEFFVYLMEKKIKFLFRLPEDFYKKEKKSMKSNDECVDIMITKARTNHIKDEKTREKLNNMEKIRLRVTKIPLKKEEEHLISNLYIDEVDYKQMKALYNQRWKIETSFDILKNKLYIENLSGHSQVTVEQDFNAQILVHNIVEDIKNEANKKLIQKKT